MAPTALENQCDASHVLQVISVQLLMHTQFLVIQASMHLLGV